jgi:AcrR family transcriptional regulator
MTTARRTRDPQRRERILTAAADLVAQNGFRSVGIADIGAAAGVTGSAIYRHFDSKIAVLLELLDRTINRLLQGAHEILADTPGAREALSALIDQQVTFVIEDRELAIVYYTESGDLPDDDRRRLRRKQRLYLEEWVSLLTSLRPDLPDGDARTVVHAAIGAIQSSLFFNSGLPEDRQRRLLADAARAVLALQ